jgi:hypothetical protein
MKIRTKKLFYLHKILGCFDKREISFQKPKPPLIKTYHSPPCFVKIPKLTSLSILSNQKVKKTKTFQIVGGGKL